jgi:hypothetical protein
VILEPRDRRRLTVAANMATPRRLAHCADDEEPTRQPQPPEPCVGGPDAASLVASVADAPSAAAASAIAQVPAALRFRRFAVVHCAVARATANSNPNVGYIPATDIPVVTDDVSAQEQELTRQPYDDIASRRSPDVLRAISMLKCTGPAQEATHGTPALGPRGHHDGRES